MRAADTAGIGEKVSKFQVRFRENRRFRSSSTPQVTGLVLSLQYEPMLPWKHLRCTDLGVGLSKRCKLVTTNVHKLSTPVHASTLL